MNKLIKITILQGVIIGILLLLLFLLPSQKGITEVCFGENCFQVEVADSLEEQKRGLMFQKSLEKDRGMLFLYKEEGKYAFWMKNTLIPLDIIWMNKEKEVIFIKDRAQPCQADPCEIIDPYENDLLQETKYALEINGGLANEFGINVGDKMVIK